MMHIISFIPHDDGTGTDYSRTLGLQTTNMANSPAVHLSPTLHGPFLRIFYRYNDASPSAVWAMGKVGGG